MKVSARLLSSNDIESYLDQIKERFDYDKADNDLEYAVCRSVEFGAAVSAHEKKHQQRSGHHFFALPA